MTVKKEMKVAECTFFFGKVEAVKTFAKGVLVSNGEHEYEVSSVNDPGLFYIPIGKKRMVVIIGGKIVAVYIRPRMSLIHKLANGYLPTWQILGRYRPIYPENARISKKSK